MAIAFLKALVPGMILTFIVAGLIGSQGSSGGFLDIQSAMVQGHYFHWSWPMFLASTGLSWGILWMMD